MFRATSKKRKKTVTRLRSDSDDEEEANAHKEEKSSRKKSKKKKGLVVRSFDVGEGDDEAVDTKKKKSKKKDRKRKRGLGFGGAANLVVHDDDDMENNNDNQNGSSANVYYGKEALEKLKQEQKYKESVAVEDSTSEQQKNDSPVVQPQETQEEEEPALGEYISLNGKEEPSMILTGDEALDFQNRKTEGPGKAINREEHFDTVIEDDNFLNDSVDPQQAEETSSWEAEITRRAGISKNSKQQSSAGQGNDVTSTTTSSTSSSAMSLAKLRGQIQSTISQLETQHSDVDRARERRKIELTQTNDELERQEKELSESGQALEHYQQLREQLTFWTGALRDLKSRVQPIQEALADLDAEMAKRPQWRDWEDDMCAVLHQAGLLDRVLGRQPPDFVFEDTTTFVDEFGRDVKSQHAMNREKRARHRLDIQASRDQPFEEDDSDAGMGEDDIETFRVRRTALAKALEVALQELDDEYTQNPKLALIFREWRRSHPEDFKQCFANLSFGDLASVLVQVELCKSRTSNKNSQGWMEEGSKIDDDGTFGWIRYLGSAEDKGKGNGIPTSMPASEVSDRVVEKAYIPLLSTVLDKGAYNVISMTQSQALSALYAKLSKFNDKKNNPQFESLTRQLFDYIKTSLENVAIAILNNSKTEHANGNTEEDDNSQSKQELAYAMRGATAGQLQRISKMLVNVITYWSPHLSAETGSDVVEFLLDFLSGRYLFLLSSLKSRSDCCTKDVFSRVWKAMGPTKWLDQPGRMLQAAPLRAAASAYQLN